MFCWHKYSKWSKAYLAYSGIRQSAYCKKCGKIKVRRISSNEMMGSQSIATGSPGSVNRVFEE